MAQFTKINERSELVACRAADYKSAALPIEPHRHIKLNDPNEIRTRVTAVKGRCLNRLTMEPKKKKTPRVGLEPTTTRLTAECSTIELSRNNTWYTTAYSSSLTQIQVDVNTFYFMYLQNFIQKVLRLHFLQSLPLIFRTSQDKSSTY